MPREHRFPSRRPAARHAAMPAPLPRIEGVRIRGQPGPVQRSPQPPRLPGTPSAQFAADQVAQRVASSHRVMAYPMAGRLKDHRSCGREFGAGPDAFCTVVVMLSRHRRSGVANHQGMELARETRRHGVHALAW